jgi:hypothetical protein
MGPCGAPVMELMADGSRDDEWMGACAHRGDAFIRGHWA